MSKQKLEKVEKNLDTLEQKVSSICEPFESNNISVHGSMCGGSVLFYVTNKLTGKCVRVLTIGTEEGMRYMNDNLSPLTLETQILIEEEILNAFKVFLSMKKELMSICKMREEYIIEENKIIKGIK
ncbi:MAG: hypothetical protein RBR32_13455 [Bacteroidales bacterium]|nr:hypothetical protein [Bacteroidales bacterium]